MNRRSITVAAVAVVALAVTAACGSSGQSEADDASATSSPASGSPSSASSGTSGAGDSTVHFGVMLPLTGENAQNGKQIKDAVELYADQYNAADHPFSIKLTVRDDRGEPKTATNIAREFAEDDSILGVVGSFTSTASMAAAPILDKAGILQISPTSSHPKFTTMGDCIFRGTPTQDLEATAIAKYTVETLGKKKAAIVYRQDDWGHSAAQSFQKGFEDNGGTITSSEAVAPDSRDFRTLVTSLKSSGVDTLYLALQYSDAAVLAQQMEASAWHPTIVTATSLYTHELIKLSDKKAVDGWNVPAFFYAESSEAIVTKFVDAFQAKYNMLPDAFGAVGYDSMKVLLDGLDKAGTADRDALCKAMYKVDVPGTTGEMKFDDNGDVRKSITWLKIQDGEFIPSE